MKAKLAAAMLTVWSLAANALDIMEGKMFAVPAPAAGVKIDGQLDDWDLSNREWLAISRDIADRFAGEVAVMYDRDALYLAAEINTAGGPMVNTNKPGEKPWLGHDIEFRCIADPTVPFPLNVAKNNPDDPSVKPWASKIKTLTLWEETVTHTPHLTIACGPPYYGTHIVDPPEAKLAFVQKSNPDRYVLEARIPWSLLGVPDGKNPFLPGQAMTAFWTVMWPQSITQRAEALRTAPTGNFGWASQHVKNWGQIEFSPDNNLPKRHDTLAEYLKKTESVPPGDKFTVEMPFDGYLAVNIVDANGEILREVGGRYAAKGKADFYFDGYDWRGNALPPGEYRYRAYAHSPLSVKFVGAAGTSAKVPYETTDAKGNWGGNMGPPTGVAATGDGGAYLLWGSNEGGHSIVKINCRNDVLWRATPYVIEGGYGPHIAVAANQKYAYVLSGWFNNFISRYDADNGLTAPFGTARVLKLDDFSPTPPQQNEWNSPMPSASGIAVNDRELFVPFQYRGVVKVYDAETGALKRELACPSPRAVALDDDGNLWVLCRRDVTGWHNPPTEIVRFAKGDGQVQKYMTLRDGLIGNPWDLTVAPDGRIFVSDNGGSNQVWVIGDRKIIDVIGRPGGRKWSGKYDNSALLRPAGLSYGKDQKLWIAQSSLPDVFSCYDGKTLKLTGELFGEVGYCPPAWPDADDPLKVYVREYYTNGMVRSQLKGDGSSGGADAYWRFDHIPDWPHELNDILSNFRPAMIFKAKNGKKYQFSAGMDLVPTAILRIDGEKLTPVNLVRNSPFDEKIIEFWSDLNDNGQIDADEVKSLTADYRTGAVNITPSGDLYIVGSDNKVRKFTAQSVTPGGSFVWDLASPVTVASDIIPGGRTKLYYGPREEIVGIDIDSQGNIYLAFSTNLEYASKKWSDLLRFGLGHTGRYNAVKITGFAPDGKRLFLAGRKATGVLKDGEMYHHWCQAGMLGDNYVAVSSEWTPFTLYTTDGFFVQSLLADPNRGETPSAYSLGGGETFSGQLKYYPDRNEAYLYTGNTHGMVYQIEGLGSGGKIKQESRFDGVMTLTQNVDPFAEALPEAKVVIRQFAVDPMQSGNWGDKTVQLYDNSGNKLALLDFGRDREFFYARFRVTDKNDFVNRADDPAMAFKLGDSAGVYLGDNVRLIATVLQGKPEVIALLKNSDLSAPYEYFTTAGGRHRYAFAAVLPGSRAKFVKTVDGYTMEFAAPLKYLPALESGKTVNFEAEVLLSGNGVRGLQAISRNHLFTPRSAGQAKMVDDIPSEARSYPEYQKPAAVE